MKYTSNLRLIPLNKRVTSIIILIVGIAISVVIFLPYILVEEPYFITIQNDDDLKFWSSSGNGTIENPYTIEGHHIQIPRNDPDDFDVPCIPENSVISIHGVTKSFVIQNNYIEVRGGCEYDSQYIISISDISVPFAIRNNYFRGGYADCFRLHNIDGLNSVISNNRIYSAGAYISNSHNISFSNNQFSTRGNAYGTYIYQSTNISYVQNYFYLSDVNIRDCSHILLHDNIFENDETYSSWILVTIWETDYCTITDNTFINGGLDLRSFEISYPTAIISGNIINGKPYGLFYNQTNVIIDGTTKYGQIKLVFCKCSKIIDQVISKISPPILIENCVDTTVANSTISNCKWGGVLIKSSINTSVLDCVIEVRHTGVMGEDSHGIFVKRNMFSNSIYGIHLDGCTGFIEEDNVFEGVEWEVESY